MPTPYSKVFDKFFLKVSDYDFPHLDDDIQKKYLNDLLESSVDDFSELCMQDLSLRDYDTQQFEPDLTGREKEILAIGMAFHWIEPRFLNEDAIRNSMSTKDYTFHSPANL